MLKATENGEDPVMNLIKERFTKKRIVGWVAQNSVRFVVVSAINNIVPAETRIKKVRRFIGANVIADIAAHHAREWIDAMYDEEVEKKEGPKAPPFVDGEVVSSSVVPYDASTEAPTTPTAQEHDGHESAQQQQHAAEVPTGDRAAEGTASSPGTGDPAQDPVESTSL